MLVIDSAVFSDIAGIILVQTENLLMNKDKLNTTQKEFYSSKGFLIHSFTGDDLEKIIEDQKNHILLVGSENNEVVGYFLGYNLGEWMKYKPDWIHKAFINLKLKNVLQENKILYGRHVARKPLYRGKQIGRKLEHAAFQESKKQEYQNIIVEILERPIPNEVSIKVHASLGYVKIGTMLEGDNLEWGIWKKDL